MRWPGVEGDVSLHLGAFQWRTDRPGSGLGHMNVLVSLGVAVLILVVLCTLFVRVSRKVRRGGSGETIASLGCLYDLHTASGRRAIETIAEVKAGKKMEEQEASDNKD